MNLEQALNNRYTVKKFDTEKKLTNEEMNAVKELLRLAPSSVNIQPWHFIIATDEASKAKIAKSTEQHSFNTEKLQQAAAVVIFNTISLTEDHLVEITEKEDADGRYSAPEWKEQMDSGRRMGVKLHEELADDLNIWLEKQIYLNVGHFVQGLAQIGIDSVIMEGFNQSVIDAEFNLAEKNMHSNVIVAIGHRAEDDFNADLPKSRLAESSVITEL